MLVARNLISTRCISSHSVDDVSISGCSRASATCYPGFEKYLDGATYTATLVEEDGLITTGEGPAAALPYGYKLLSYFVSADEVAQLEQGMMYSHLMESR